MARPLDRCVSVIASRPIRSDRPFSGGNSTSDSGSKLKGRLTRWERGLSLPHTIQLMPIETSESFPDLKNVPVTEAIFEVRTAATVPWRASAISDRFKEALPDYPKVEARQELSAEFKFGEGEAQLREANGVKWKGLQMTSGKEHALGRFEDGLFSFSKAYPYVGWEAFTTEALRLWSVYREIAQPDKITRFGVRFINRILIPTSPIQIEDFLVSAPKEPQGLEFPYINFLYRDIMAVPESDYIIRLTRSIGPQKEGEAGSVALIVDVDVSTSAPFDVARELLSQKLSDIRWLKNKAFFGSIKEAALNLLK